MAAKNISFNGKDYTSQSITGFVTRFENNEEELQLFLNVATLQVALHGNCNWLNVIFDSRTMRLKSGELNKQGKECLAYVKDHCPLVLWNKKEKKVEKKKTKAGNKLNGKLAVPFETQRDELTGNEEKLLVSAEESPEFMFSLSHWRDIVASRDSDAPVASNKKASTLINQLASMAALLAGEKETTVVGTREELKVLEEKAELVAAMAAAMAAAMPSPAAKIETDMAGRVASTTSKKEGRADVDREEHDRKTA